MIASQTFNVKGGASNPSWSTGQLDVPPGGKKEPEGVQNCTQVFYVLSGQPKALEVAIAVPEHNTFDPNTAQRIILSPGDEFYVPPKNSYMLWNHSDNSTSALKYFIMKPSE